ncbi:MAG: acetolactate synthase small subunit [Parcubacteria group bacterium]|nr:acetolactate synthase small subunit [Parcubacteria group bacterium]
MKKKRDIINIWVENRPGVLGKISSICRRRNFNIETITAGRTHVADQTLITLVAVGAQIDQVINQINKLIEVVRIEQVNLKRVNVRELLILRIANRRSNKKLFEYIKKRGNLKILEKNKLETVLEITANHINADKIVSKIDNKDIKELIRTGLTAVKKINK